MGLRLRVLCRWTPNWVLSRELDHVSRVTADALKSLIATYAPNNLTQNGNVTHSSKTVEEKRSLMAAEHAMLVEALATAIGREETLQLAREVLFKVGQNLGMESRGKLGVGSDPKDLIRAATILYRVIGIEFNIESSDRTRATLVVDRCALSQHYSELTCKVLSATDEGVVKGLNPHVNMVFKEVLTSGCPKCRAQIEFMKPRNKT
jgi:hypothetical protein